MKTVRSLLLLILLLPMALIISSTASFAAGAQISEKIVTEKTRVYTKYEYTNNDIIAVFVCIPIVFIWLIGGNIIYLKSRIRTKNRKITKGSANPYSRIDDKAAMQMIILAIVIVASIMITLALTGHLK